METQSDEIGRVQGGMAVDWKLNQMSFLKTYHSTHEETQGTCFNDVAWKCNHGMGFLLTLTR